MRELPLFEADSRAQVAVMLGEPGIGRGSGSSAHGFGEPLGLWA